MKIRVQSIHFTADSKLLDFIQTRVDKLDQFFDQIISGEVYLKLENADNEENKITEIKLFDNTGTLKKHQKFTGGTRQTSINISGLLPGLYYIEIYNGKEKETQQVVIAK